MNYFCHILRIAICLFSFSFIVQISARSQEAHTTHFTSCIKTALMLPSSCGLLQATLNFSVSTHIHDTHHDLITYIHSISLLALVLFKACVYLPRLPLVYFLGPFPPRYPLFNVHSYSISFQYSLSPSFFTPSLAPHPPTAKVGVVVLTRGHPHTQQDREHAPSTRYKSETLCCCVAEARPEVPVSAAHAHLRGGLLSIQIVLFTFYNS